MYINKEYFPVLLGSKNTFRCYLHYIRAVAVYEIAALALLEGLI